MVLGHQYTLWKWAGSSGKGKVAEPGKSPPEAVRRLVGWISVWEFGSWVRADGCKGVWDSAQCWTGLGFYPQAQIAADFHDFFFPRAPGSCRLCWKQVLRFHCFRALAGGEPGSWWVLVHCFWAVAVLVNAEGMLTPWSAEAVVTSVRVQIKDTNQSLLPCYRLTPVLSDQLSHRPAIPSLLFPVCMDDVCSAFSRYASTRKSLNTSWLGLKVRVRHDALPRLSFLTCMPSPMYFTSCFLGLICKMRTFGCAPGPAAALWGQGVADSIASTLQEPVCLHGMWRAPQPSQTVALHSVDTGRHSLSFERVYCNALGSSKNLPSW